MQKQKTMKNRNGNLLREKAYAHIKEGIVNGTFKPTGKITQKTLSSRIGTSRTPVREALLKLEKEKLVYRLPGRGLTIKGITEDEVEEVLELQSLLEGYAANLATSKITSHELAVLKDIIARQEESAAKNDIESFMYLDREFHFAIDKAAKSKLLSTLLKDLRDLLHRYSYRAIIFRRSSMLCSIREHGKLLDLMKARAAGKAEKLIKKHVFRGKNLIKRKVKRQFTVPITDQPPSITRSHGGG